MELTAKRARGRKAVKMLSASFAGLLLVVGCVGVTRPLSASGKPHVEDCLAGFCLLGAKVMESEVIAKLGEGYTRREAPVVGNNIHCYFDPTQEAWIEFTFDHHHQSGQLLEVFASRTPLCDRAYQPKTWLQPVKTAGGIALGSTKADVLRVYGEPLRIDDHEAMERLNPLNKDTYLAARFGSHVLIYDAYPESDELRHAGFYLRENKVQSIWVSISE